MKNLQEDGRIKACIIVANYHYAGFDLYTANIFTSKLGLSDAKWENREIKVGEQEQERSLHHDLKQRSM